MAYVSVPKDLAKIKTKVAFNMTKRQIVCFGVALIVGLPSFFLLKENAGKNIAALVMVLIMLPCFLFAMYEKHGQPLETVLKTIIEVKFFRPQKRPYQTDNLYAALERQKQLERELVATVKNKQKKPTKK